MQLYIWFKTAKIKVVKFIEFNESKVVNYTLQITGMHIINKTCPKSTVWSPIPYIMSGCVFFSISFMHARIYLQKIPAL